MEQEVELELESIFKFVLNAVGDIESYDGDMPQDFYVPSAYFAVPEISAHPDTFNTYYAEYSWYITFFHFATQDAYKLGLKALTAIEENRNLIPLLDENGNKTGKTMRILDPSLKIIDECAARLIIRFRSRRPYKEPERIKMQIHKTILKIKGGT